RRLLLLLAPPESELPEFLELLPDVERQAALVVCGSALFRPGAGRAAVIPAEGLPDCRYRLAKVFILVRRRALRHRVQERLLQEPHIAFIRAAGSAGLV